MRRSISRKTFPVLLMLEGRSCLVVGGGVVAARKAGKLLAAGARVRVVAPQICADLKSIETISLEERAFCEIDVEGAYLVFAVTDDADVNLAVVQACRQNGVLCSVADASWPEGDLILPASFEADGLTVSVSTGGRSCRRSRLLKASLQRHVAAMQDADLLVMGIDVQTEAVEALESIKRERHALEKHLGCVHGVHEYFLLDTCNRFELVALVATHPAVMDLLRVLPGLTGNRYCYTGSEAFERLCETASGLHSTMFGETRIVGQMKAALQSARQAGQAGGGLQGCLDLVLHVSKAIRRELAASVVSVDVEDALARYELDGANVLIVGTGALGQSLAKRYAGAEVMGGRDKAALRSSMQQKDAVIWATAADEYILTEADAAWLPVGIKLFDLSIPRNVDPGLPGVIDLMMLRSGRPEGINEIFGQARAIVQRHAGDFRRLVEF